MPPKSATAREMLINKGKQTMESLLHRRKRVKSDQTTHNHKENVEAEDDDPILSKAIPSSQDTKEIELVPDISRYEPLDEAVGATSLSHKRRGIVGLESLQGNRSLQHHPIHNNTGCIADTPAASNYDQRQFTFTAASHGVESHSPTDRWTGATTTSSQLPQASCNPFQEPQPMPANTQEEQPPSEKGTTIQDFINQDHNTSRAGTGDDKPSPLDHLKLGANTKPSHVRIDKATPTEAIGDFCRPQNNGPATNTEIYRNKGYNPNIPHELVHSTVPGKAEAHLFAADVEGDDHTPLRWQAKSLREGDQKQRTPLHDPITTAKPTPLSTKGAGGIRLPPRAARPLARLNLDMKSDEERVPDTFYTAPNRLPNAFLAARHNLKRKRPADPTALPPPSYTYQHTDNPNFNIFRNGFLLYPELCLLLAAQLPVKTLITLYSLSKDYHIIINQRITTVILNQLTLKAPHAPRSYPWKCFHHLSQADPSLRSGTSSLATHLDPTGPRGATISIHPAQTPPPLPPKHLPNTTTPTPTPIPRTTSTNRRVPTFRYLHLALHREKSIWRIYHLFAARGVPLPGHPSHTHAHSFASTLHKLWFLFDIPDNARRCAYIHAPRLFSAADLSNALVFVVKLDMLCNDPLGGEKRDAVRKMLMSAVDGFDTLRRVLGREEWRGELDVLRGWVRYGFQMREGAVGGGWVPLGLGRREVEASRSVFGVGREEVGVLKREFWGMVRRGESDGPGETRRGITREGEPMFLMRPDQLVLREAVRRGMVFSKQFLRALLYGYVDEESDELKALDVQDVNGGRSWVLESEGEYDMDDVVAGVQALSVSEGGDDLLDLGDADKGSPWTTVHARVSKAERETREKERSNLSVYMQAMRDEMDEERQRRASLAYHFVD